MSLITAALIKLWKGLMRIIYFFIKLAPTKNKVTMISRQTDGDNLDFNLLADALRERQPATEIVILNKRFEQRLFKLIVSQLHMFRQMYHIATSSVVVLDSYAFAVSILNHKRELEVIQMWHALGSLKKFGYSILDKPEGRNSNLADIMDMHKHYDYVITSSKSANEHFKEAFDVSGEQIRVIGLPRIDFLLDQEMAGQLKRRFGEVYPAAVNGKANILYVPTNNKSRAEEEELARRVDYGRYNFIVKLHDGRESLWVDGRRIVDRDVFKGVELLHVSDYVITDYSAIVFEAALAQKPLYFYVPDYDEYMKSRGVYIPYWEEMPGVISRDSADIFRAIEADLWYPERIRAFAARYVTYRDGSVCQRLADFIGVLLLATTGKEQHTLDQANF